MLVEVLLLLLYSHLEFISSINGREEEVNKLTKKRGNHGRGLGPSCTERTARHLWHPPHQSQPSYPERLLFIHEAGLPLDNPLQHAGGGMLRQPNRTPEHAHTNYIEEVAELPQEIFGQRVVGQDHPDDQSDSPESSLNENRGHSLQGNGQVRQNKILRTSRREPAPELLSPVLRALLKRDDRQGNQSRSRNFRGIPKTAEQQYEMDEIRPLPRQIVRRGIEHDRNGQQRYAFTKSRLRRGKLRDLDIRRLTTSKAPP